MKLNFENYQQLPDGDLPNTEIMVQTEWEVPNEKVMAESIERIIETFNKYSLNHESSKGELSYTCFLNVDKKHLIHFSQWKNKDAIQFFNENDPKERIPELLANLEVKRLGRTEYSLYKTLNGTNRKEDTNLIVFVKQYFKKKGQAKDWIELILETLMIEKPTKGLIQNTYYLSKNGLEILNYALWENESDYAIFLNHPNPSTAKKWSVISNYEGRIKEKGEVKRHKKFIKIN